MLGLLSTIKGKLISASSVTALLALCGIGITMYTSNLAMQQFVWQSRHVNPLSTAVGKMTTYGLDGGSRLRMQALTDNLSPSSVSALKKLLAEFDGTLTHAQKLAADRPDISSRLAVIAKDWKPVEKDRKGILKAMQNSHYSRALALLLKENDAWLKLRGALHELNSVLETQRRQGSNAIMLAIRHTWLWSTALLLSAMLLGGGLLLVTITSTVWRIGTVLKMMQTVSAGDADLSRRLTVKGNDEMDRIAEAFNRFVERIHDVISNVAQSASKVSSSSHELSTFSEQMRVGAQHQHTETEQVASAVHEMNATAQEIARNIERTSDLASKAAKSGQLGVETAGSAVTVVGDLQNELERSTKAVGELGQGVIDIGSIVDLINQIADQTNLLALNAAIEAARAGEQGRGFAVVAEEVRSLALKTQDATSKIRDMMERVRHSAETAVGSMDSTQRRSQAAGEGVERVEEVLNEVVGMVTDIADRAAQIATAAEQQSAVTDEINRNVSNIRVSAEESSGALEQSAASANGLATLATELRSLVGQFRGV